MISTFGINFSKRFLFSFASIKWVIIGLAFFIVIAFAFIDNNFVNNFATTKAVGAATIFGSVVSFLFAFGGMGDISALSKDTKTKNFRKILMSVFYTIFIFYFIFYIFFLGIREDVNVDPNTSAFAQVFILAFGSTGLILFAIGLFFNQSAGRISSTIATGRKLAPLAIDGYFPAFLGKKNKNDEYKNAIYFSVVLSIFSMIFLNIIPRIFNLEDSFESILQIGTLGFVFQYFFTTLTVVVLAKKKLIKKIPRWEISIYYAGLVIMFVVFLVVLVPPIVGEPWTLSNTIKTPTFIFVFVAGYLTWYFTSVDKKRALKNYQKGFKNSLDFHSKLDSKKDFQKFSWLGIVALNLLLPVIGSIIYGLLLYDRNRMYKFYLKGSSNQLL